MKGSLLAGGGGLLGGSRLAVGAADSLVLEPGLAAFADVSQARFPAGFL